MALRRTGCRLAAFLFFAAASLFAQQCDPPQAQRDPQALAPALEDAYGVIADINFRREYKIYDDDELVGYLRQIGARLAPHVKGLGNPPQFFLYDDLIPQGYSLPGGRVYVSRKAVSFAQSEDELASILAHELGHAATGHASALFAERVRGVLGVRTIQEPAEVADLYHRMVETYREKRLKRLAPDRDEQENADTLGMYAMMRAGYDPQAMVTLFDRAAQTKGKTGSWFSDLFGATTPGSKRLRELAKQYQALGVTCRALRQNFDAESFRAWQLRVGRFQGWGRKEQVAGLLAKTRVAQPLESELDHVRYSPDGKHLLAQDGAAIYVLTREPMKLIATIEVENAYPARFTADSRYLLYHDRRQRIGKFDLESAQAEDVRELVLPDGCRASELSPDAAYLLCYTTGSNLVIVEVESGAEVLRQQYFGPQRLRGALALLARLISPTLKFSPDGRYAVASYLSDPIVYDLAAKKYAKIPKELEKAMRSGFHFSAAGEVYVGDAVMAFPAGGVLRKFPQGRAPIPATDSRYYARSVVIPKDTKEDQWLAAVAEKLAARPAPTPAASGRNRPKTEVVWALFEQATDKPLLAARSSAMDVFGGELLAESRGGELRKSPLAEKDGQGVTAELPRGRLGSYRAFAVSPGLERIAVAQNRRGAVWNLESNRREQDTPPFRAAHFLEPAVMVAEFPADDDEGPAMYRLQPAESKVESLYPLAAEELRQVGSLLYSMTPGQDASGEPAPTTYDKQLRESVYPAGITLAVADAASGKALWERVFARERPVVSFSYSEDSMVLLWNLASTEVQRMAAQDPAIAARVASMGKKTGDYLVEVLEARTGQRRHWMTLETGNASFAPRRIFAAGKWLVVTDSHRRVLIYSLADGQIKGRFFGDGLLADAQGNHLAIVSARGELEVVELGSMRRLGHRVLEAPIAFVAFDRAGSRILAFTNTQTAYTFQLAGAK